MSRILFHTKYNETVEVLGMEAHLIHHLDKRIGTGILYEKLTELNFKQTPLNTFLSITGSEELLKKSHLTGQEVKDIIDIIKCGHLPTKIKYKNDWVNSWIWFLNMNSIYGSDVMCLIGQISAQMEIHCHIYKKNFKWFRKLIKNALKQEILRKDMGWDNVINLLKNKKNDLIVLSYSVTEPFPNKILSERDDFYNFAYEDQWDICVKKLNPNTEITPKSIRREYKL